ncbi:uncharacterized protein FOMMEDRAFT_19622 [Fomitiporia mediterranea MF3/22]|uniref:uncharacterized protein n=1 Tax=Fomitiporia mediterranea (strain MF3/22) TaxID=694068 RepID=UPI0004408BBD|nr:uncharacterized protein FOMMEDRAFT_19622 [Fomitiporia mediterranea MF3/22]EJD04383.1 hypothetical protein FOMMEDRAFT_19622 [Fomitiporia mediterranea MF3/22]
MKESSWLFALVSITLSLGASTFHLSCSLCPECQNAPSTLQYELYGFVYDGTWITWLAGRGPTTHGPA